MTIKAIKNVEWLLEAYSRNINSIDYVNNQIEVYVEKVWNIVEQRKVINQEVADRTYNFYLRRLDGLLEEQKEVVENLQLINEVLALNEEFVWKAVEFENKSTFFYKAPSGAFIYCFLIFFFFLLP